MRQRRLKLGLAHMSKRVGQLRLLLGPEIERKRQLTGVIKAMVGPAEG
jgi:hypothetical protein